MVLCLAFTSCKSLQTYYQVCDVKSSLPQSTHGGYEYKDASCTVSYDFWCNGGNPGFTITNNTNEIIYVDLANSFYIKNGVAYDYFLNRVITSSAAYAETIATGKSGTAYGYWNTIAGLVPGSLTASVGEKSTAQKSTSVATEEKSVISIPPHASKFITEYNISALEFTACEFDLTPKRHNTPKYDFSLVNSPLVFSNYITYRVGDDTTNHVITNDFYVGSITVYHADDAVIEQTVGCPGNTHKIDVLRDEAPQKYYIRYSRETKSSINSPKKGPAGNTKRDKYDDIW